MTDAGGPMFVRMCPYFPFSARICLNQHHWLANRMREEGIPFRQCTNAFLSCGDPKRLQELADSLTAQDLLSCGRKWLAAFTPFFTAKERKVGCQHNLFFAQVEYCDNLVFRRRAALDQMEQRLLDANRNIGQPSKITSIFGRKVTKHYRGKLQTVIDGSQPAESGDSQSLRQRIHQAVCSGPCRPENRTGFQQCNRLTE